MDTVWINIDRLPINDVIKSHLKDSGIKFFHTKDLVNQFRNYVITDAGFLEVEFERGDYLTGNRVRVGGVESFTFWTHRAKSNWFEPIPIDFMGFVASFDISGILISIEKI